MPAFDPRGGSVGSGPALGSIDPECQTQECCPDGMPVLLGDDTDNTLRGGRTAQCIVGLAGNDDLSAGSAGDVILGGADADILRGSRAADLLSGGPGVDDLDGGDGDDELHGGHGDDTIRGGKGNDILFGEQGNDHIEGGDGNDEIRPGPGVDTAYGDAGDDTFVIISACEVSPGEIISGGTGTDRVQSPFSRAELESMGVRFDSIEVFEAIVDPRYGMGACYPDPDVKIRCECCDAGWGGLRCRTCVDSSICGRPSGDGPYALPLETRYHREPIPEFTQGVYAESVGVRRVIQLSEPPRPDPDGSGWHFDDGIGSVEVVQGGTSLGAFAPRADGSRVWTLGFHSPNAATINLTLEDLTLPPGAVLWAYSELAIHGPVTDAELGGKPRTFVPPLPGDTLYLEILEPPDGDPIAVGTIDAGLAGTGVDDACFEDVACHPSLGNASNSVARILHSDAWCSASLLNNTTPGESIVLTAEHCLARQPSDYLQYLAGSPNAGVTWDGSWMQAPEKTWVQFHYQNLSCNAFLAELPDFYQTLTFPIAEVLYHDHEVDIGVLRVDGQPDPKCVTYTGFDARKSLPTPSASAGIRHPQGRVAQLDYDAVAAGKAPYQDENPDILANFVYQGSDPFWERHLAGAGDLGWVRGGSSGGPLFNPQLRVIGHASGFLDGNPETSCEAPFIRFFDGRLNAAVEISDLIFTGSEEPKRLRYRLGDTERDLALLTESNPLPLGFGDLTPCADGDWHAYVVNPYVIDDVVIHWSWDAEPGQVLANSFGTLPDTPQDYSMFLKIAEVNPGGTEPPITVHVDTSFPAPHDANCFTIEQRFEIQPVDCI